MGPLSNFQRKARALLGLGGSTDGIGPAGGAVAVGGDAGGDAVRCRPARRAEVRPAVRLLLSAPGRPAGDADAAAFVAAAPARRLDLGRLRVADRRGRLAWAVLPVVSPGRTALLLVPPTPAAAADRAAAAALLDHAAAELAAGGVRLAQSLLDPADAAGRALFAGRRFAEMAELVYLAGEPSRRAAAPLLPPGFGWVGYADPPAAAPHASPHALFERTIAATYQNSLDCPALNGVRDMADVVAGHQASGEFDPGLWRVLVGPGGVGGGGDPVPLGVLLLAPIPQAEAVELVYLGLVPAGRGRRLGDLLVRQALSDVAAAGAGRLTLAVDAGNAPALKLYYRHGLARTGARIAMMRDLAGTAHLAGASRGPSSGPDPGR